MTSRYVRQESAPNITSDARRIGLLRRARATLARHAALLNEYNYIAILQSSVRKAAPASGLTLVERTHEPFSALHTYARFNRDITTTRISQRIDHGLRYFEVHANGCIVASTWIIGTGTRFMDELGIHIPIPAGSFWIRDVFVAPEMRGRRLLGTFIDLLAARPYLGCTAVWSDVSIRNKASLNAHLAYGFKEVSRLRSRHLFKTIMIREIDWTILNSTEGFKQTKRVLWTGPAFLRYCDRNLA